MSMPDDESTWRLRLYVNGASPLSMAAIENIRSICDSDLAGKVDLVVIDVRAEPALVVADEVYAAPTLVKQLPEPLRRLVGDLSDAVRVRAGLDLSAEDDSGSQAENGSENESENDHSGE